MSGPYVQVGPFLAGSAPGLSAAYANGLESALLQLQGSIGATTINGGTGGTATCHEVLQGPVKMCVIQLAAFQTGGVAQDWILPVAFTACSLIIGADVSNFRLRNTGADQNSDVWTTLAAGGGSTTNQPTVHVTSIAGNQHAFDTLRFDSGGAGPHTGIIVIIGV